ncbi:putative ubiquinol-cytochrome c chaperone/UPF0174 [Helianthus anomalus]
MNLPPSEPNSSQLANCYLFSGNPFRLEKTFRTNFSMLVVHMWLCLRRLKAEGKEGVELGQYVYEIYNHDLETRVSKAGVSHLPWLTFLLLIFQLLVKWSSNCINIYSLASY